LGNLKIQIPNLSISRQFLNYLQQAYKNNPKQIRLIKGVVITIQFVIIFGLKDIN